jgi:SAM-dependent methyltransferase
MDRWLDSMVLMVLRCPACGHHWYRDQPEDDQLSAMYSASRSFFGCVTIDRQPSDHMRRQMRRLRRLLGTGATPHLLDYGSGFGRWARAAMAEGFDVCAYEPSVVRGAEVAAEFTVTHDLASLRGRRFHAVNLEQVLEHVPDPLAVLTSLHDLCLPGAIVRITVPNIDRPHEGTRLWRDWPFNGRSVHTMAPFEHLHGFTPVSLACLVRRARFRMVNWKRIALTHTDVWSRRMAAHMWRGLGQTFVLVEPDQLPGGDRSKRCL